MPVASGLGQVDGGEPCRPPLPLRGGLFPAEKSPFELPLPGVELA